MAGGIIIGDVLAPFPRFDDENKGVTIKWVPGGKKGRQCSSVYDCAFLIASSGVPIQ